MIAKNLILVLQEELVELGGGGVMVGLEGSLFHSEFPLMLMYLKEAGASILL